MEKIIHLCDFCGEIIDRYHPKGHVMIFPTQDGNQKWPLPDGTIIDVCQICCIALKKAEDHGLIKIDWAPIFELSGLKYDEKDDYWTHPTHPFGVQIHLDEVGGE